MTMEKRLCQRPKRAYAISTKAVKGNMLEDVLCQRPKRAYAISTFAREMEQYCERIVSTP